MDCKSHREKGRFELKSLYLEPESANRERFDEAIDAVARAIVEYARFDSCDEVVVSRTEPAFARLRLKKALSRQL